MMSIWDVADKHGNVRVRDVAAEAGVDRQTVYKWVRCGVIVHRRLPVSGRIMFKAADVERFLASSQAPSAAQL